MSVCFYINSARMMGLDVHDEIPCAALTDMYAIWPGTWDKDTDSVSTGGFDFIQDGYDLFLVCHQALVISPKAGLVALAATATGSSKPFLAKMTVLGEGKPLACCVDGWLGANANCWSAGPIKKSPSGIVLSPTSVVTTPSPGDWAAAVVGLLFDNVKSFAVGSIMKGHGLSKLPATILKQLMRYTNHLAKYLDKKVGFPISPLMPAVRAVKSSGIKGTLKKAVQEAVDDWFED